MAAITPTVENRLGWRKYVWTPVTEADTYVAVEIDSSSADRSVAITGTIGGATVVITGSNDGSTYFTLTDPQGNSISKTANALEQITEITQYIKPTHSGGSSQSSVVTVFCARQK